MSKVLLNYRSKSGEIQKCELFYSGIFSLLNINTELGVELDNGWIIALKFVSNDEFSESKTRTDFEGTRAIITLTNWHHDTWIENTDPISIYDQPNKKIELLIKVRSSAMKEADIRQVAITVWKVLK